jgi:hypothetical protein
VRWVSDVRGHCILFSPWSINHWQPGKLFRPWYGAVEFDMASDRARIVYANVKSPAGPDLNIAPDTIVSDHRLYPPYLETTGGVWGVDQTLSLLPGNGGPLAATPDTMRLGKYPQSEISGLLEPLDEGRFVAADKHAVWIIEPAAK